MATIAVDIPTIAGECQIAGYQNKIDAVGISDAISRPLAFFTGPGGLGSAVLHSPICLKRYRDTASPLIAKACSSAANLGEVKIYLFRTSEAATVPYMVFKLGLTYVSSISYSTADSLGISFLPQLLEDASIPQAGLSILEDVFSALGHRGPSRPTYRPAVSSNSMNYTDSETERVWLNAATITWTYTQYINGNRAGDTSKGWNIEEGVTATT